MNLIMNHECHEALLAAGFRLREAENRWMRQPFVGSFRVLWYWYARGSTEPVVSIWWPYHEGHWSRHEWKTKRVYSLARTCAKKEMALTGIGPEMFDVAKVLGVCS